MNAQNEKENIKEPFCPVCVAAVPLAFSMTAGAASTAIEEKKRRNQIILWSTIIGIVSLILIIYFLCAVQCSSCA